jgi:3-oxoacyl-[acyl-carrier protein] reductase
MVDDMRRTIYDFSGKTLLLTGAAGTIGQAIAHRFHAGGANCVLTDFDLDTVSAFARTLDPGLTRTLALKQDVTEPADADRVAAEAAKRFGGIDALVTSAGIYRDALVEEMTDAQWQQTIAINLDGVFYTCRAAIPHMNDGGAIVNIASIAGHRGSHAHAHYAAAKGGVVVFSRSLAVELAPRIRVNSIAPGLVDGPMVQNLLQLTGDKFIQATPLKRLGTADEIAGAIAFLCSDDASFITAESLHVNGGLYIA